MVSKFGPKTVIEKPDLGLCQRARVRNPGIVSTNLQKHFPVHLDPLILASAGFLVLRELGVLTASNKPRSYDAKKSVATPIKNLASTPSRLDRNFTGCPVTTAMNANSFFTDWRSL